MPLSRPSSHDCAYGEDLRGLSDCCSAQATLSPWPSSPTHPPRAPWPRRPSTRREIAVLVDERQRAGSHTARLDASAWPDGIFVYRLEAGEQFTTGSLVHWK